MVGKIGFASTRRFANMQATAPQREQRRPTRGGFPAGPTIAPARTHRWARRARQRGATRPYLYSACARVIAAFFQPSCFPGVFRRRLRRYVRVRLCYAARGELPPRGEFNYEKERPDALIIPFECAALRVDATRVKFGLPPDWQRELSEVSGVKRDVIGQVAGGFYRGNIVNSQVLAGVVKSSGFRRLAYNRKYGPPAIRGHIGRLFRIRMRARTYKQPGWLFRLSWPGWRTRGGSREDADCRGGRASGCRARSRCKSPPSSRACVWIILSGRSPLARRAREEGSAPARPAIHVADARASYGRRHSSRRFHSRGAAARPRIQSAEEENYVQRLSGPAFTASPAALMRA